MVYVVHGQLFFSNAARRDAVLSDITTRISTKNRWSSSAVPEVLSATDSSKYPGPGINLRIVFVSSVDSSDLENRIESFATGARAPIAGSWLSIEESHNDEDNTTPDVATYTKVW